MKLTEFFEDSNGRFSSTRLFMLLVCFSFTFDWVYSVIKYTAFSPSIELLTFVLATLGIKAVEGIKK